MSAIFGLLHHHQAPDPALLQRMAAAMAYWGPDGSATWQEGPLGLGQLMLYNTPESVYETLPRRGQGGLAIAANVRLDNRQELLDQFQVPRAERATYPDSELIVQAYHRWGEACVHHLVGDWAFALWQPQQQRLFIARDQLGINGLYYYSHGDFFAFSSCLKGLLALPQVPQQPNLFRVAQVLTSWPGDGVQTAYRDILQLPPAHTLTVQHQRTTVERYWRLEDTPPLTLGSDQEYVETFLTHYRRAVVDRLRSHRPVGGTLSGGLDSGSVCALAAESLRPQDLPVYTHVPLQPTDHLTSAYRFGDESPYVEANREFIGNLRVNYLKSEHISPLAGIETNLWVHDQPGHAAGNHFWITDLLQTAQHQGLGTLLTGQCGNGTISWAGMALVSNGWQALLQGNWPRIVAEAEAQGLSPWRLVKRYLLRPIALPILAQRRRLQHIGKLPWADYAAIHPDFARSLRLGAAMQRAGHDPTFTAAADPMVQRLRIIRPASTTVGALWLESGAAYGLEVRDPTLDQRLVEFCLALPNDQYFRQGENRSLIRRAMRGLLPDVVRLNQTKGLQAADLGYRVVAHAAEIQAVLQRLRGSGLARQVLDLDKMTAVLDSLQRGVTRANSSDGGTILLRGLMSGLFLLRFD
jgi:asparagine synthase (glutamine-hydrolysing)